MNSLVEKEIYLESEEAPSKPDSVSGNYPEQIPQGRTSNHFQSCIARHVCLLK